MQSKLSLSSASRRRLRLVLILFPFLLLASLEGLLRFGGYGFPTAFLLRRHLGDRAVLMDNPAFGKRFFPPGLVRYPKAMVFPVEKKPNTLRVCVFGESAALGDPDPKFGLPRMLEVLLRERYPNRQIEVVAAAMVAINSHVLLPIARDCAQHQADVWVIYMGNNEMIGPFGSITLFGPPVPPLTFIRAGIALKTFRLGQLIDGTLHAFQNQTQTPTEWEGMTMWQERSVRQDAPATQRVYRYYEDNLRRILETGQRAGVPIILCTVASNLKDCAPFGSLHGERLDPAGLERWDTPYKQGLEFEAQGKLVEASAAYRRALDIDSRFADLCFRAARCSLALGQTNDALQQFRQARDLDALQFRADGRINEIIRRCAADFSPHRVELLDAEQLLAAHSPQGIAGQEFFYEHVHLKPEGNYLLARAVAERVTAALATGAQAAPTPGASFPVGARNQTSEASAEGRWISEADCLKALGFTDWHRQAILKDVLGRVSQAPFTRQVNHADQIRTLESQIEHFRPATKPFQIQRAIRDLTDLVARQPNDPDLRWVLAQFLDIADDVSRAEEQWRAVIRLRPEGHVPYYNLARLLDLHARKAEAEQTYRQCLRVNPDYFDANFALGLLLQAQDQPAEAVRYLRQAARCRRNSPEVHSALGLALQQVNQAAEAERELREASRLRSTNSTSR